MSIFTRKYLIGFGSKERRKDGTLEAGLGRTVMEVSRFSKMTGHDIERIEQDILQHYKEHHPELELADVCIISMSRI